MRLRKLVLVVLAVLLLLTMVAPMASAHAWGYCSQYYTVRYGDTLAGIAWYFGTTVYSLMSVNYIPNPNFIYAGQVLCISGGYSQGRTYVVRYGDTLARIARYFGVNVYALAQANGIYNLNLIYAGQVLTIPYY